ncbi:MAG: hypothetical protein AABX12_02985 [Nanoarchaeota archaeon]
MTPKVSAPSAAATLGYGQNGPSYERTATPQNKSYNSPNGRAIAELLISQRASDGSYDEVAKIRISDMLLVRANSIMHVSEAQDYLNIANEIRAKEMPAMADTLEYRANSFLQRNEDISMLKQTDDKNRGRTHIILDELEEQIKEQIRGDKYQALAKTADRLYDALNYAEQIRIPIDKSIRQRIEYLAEQARNAQIHPSKKAVSLFGKFKNMFKSILFK